MFRLQQAMKNADKDEILLFFESYFNDEEELEIMETRKKMEEVEHQQMRLRAAVGHTPLSFQNLHSNNQSIDEQLLLGNQR